MLKQVIAKINEEIKAGNYEPHSFEWCVCNQLIDIIVAQPDCAEIVMQDLSVEAMNIKAMIKKVKGKHLENPVTIMKTICDLYKIPTPMILPPEHWRAAYNENITPAPAIATKSKADVDFMDLFRGIE